MRNFRRAQPPASMPPSLVAIITLCLFLNGASAQAHGERWYFPNGLVATYVPSPPDDLADLIDAHIWKFKLHFTRPNTAYSYRLEWREGGKPPVLITKGGAGPTGGTRLAFKVGLVPLGLDLSKSSQFKWTTWGYADGVGGGSYGQIANPLKGASYFDEIDGDLAERRAIPLLEGESDDGEVVLVLVLAASPKLPKL